jgi:hypothetical protein
MSQLAMKNDQNLPAPREPFHLSPVLLLLFQLGFCLHGRIFRDPESRDLKGSGILMCSYAN